MVERPASVYRAGAEGKTNVETVRIKKGYRLSVAGKPSLNLRRLKAPEKVAFSPHHIRFIKPRLAVQKGDPVKVGTLLFQDKHQPELKFRSPGGGIVEAIRFGPRRVLEEIVIRLDSKETHEAFEPVSDADLDKMEKADLVGRIQEGGLWSLIRELPFRNIPSGRSDPPGIIITMGTQEPFEAEPSVYLEDQKDLFQFGIRVLGKLTSNIDIVLESGSHVPDFLERMATHSVSGEYPCGDAGVFLYHTKSDASKNRSWFLSGQDVLLLARLLRNGRYPTERIVALAGPGIRRPCHVDTRTGVPLEHMVNEDPSNGDRRWVVGGLFTGYEGSPGGYLGFHETAVAVLSENGAPEFFALFKPGYGKSSYSRAFLSRLNPSPLPVDCRYHGEERACIGCGFCTEVCPVDIFPQFTYKAVIVGEMEEALEHGILDCVECGLCSHVCPSKIELVETFKSAKATLFREQALI